MFLYNILFANYLKLKKIKYNYYGSIITKYKKYI